MKKFRTVVAILLAMLSLSAVMTAFAAPAAARKTTRANAVVLPPVKTYTAPASTSTYNYSPAAATSGAVR